MLSSLSQKSKLCLEYSEKDVIILGVFHETLGGNNLLYFHVLPRIIFHLLENSDFLLKL